MKTLTPPANPKEAIQSRRNPCYGFAVVTNLQDHYALAALLAETRDNILQVIDPDRANKTKPIKDPRYIKQKTFHAAVFGVTPLLDREQFVQAYQGDDSAFNSEVNNRINRVIQEHLDEDKPYLEPLKCEIMGDGTILARFAYKTTNSDDETAVLTLGKKLDPEGKFARWDTGNLQRYKTVAVAICVIDTEQLAEKMPQIRGLLENSTTALQVLGRINITKFMVIEDYDKRTLSPNHVIKFREIEKSNNYLNANKLFGKIASILPTFNRYTVTTTLVSIAAVGTVAYIASNARPQYKSRL